LLLGEKQTLGIPWMAAMEHLHSFLTILVTLLIIMDPMGNLPFFILFTKLDNRRERNRMALTASAAACAILFFFAITGDHVLRWFSISLPAFQIAGGAVFLIYSLQMLGLIPSGIKTSEEEEHEGISKENVALVPLAIPLMAGPGAITAVLVWRQGQAGLPILLLAIIVACLLTYIVFRFGEWIHEAMGVSGLRVVTRLMGLLLAVIAVQFMVNGFQQVLT
jgi:multiple antibiotic resistance protein